MNTWGNDLPSPAPHTERGYAPQPASPSAGRARVAILATSALLAVSALAWAQQTTSPIAKPPARGAATPALASAAPGAAAAAAGGSAAEPRRGDAIGCLIEPSVVVEIGSPVIGVLDRVLVERGDVVKKGQVVAQLDARVERAAVAVAIARAQSESEVLSARQAHEFALRKQERNESLFRQNYISSQALDQAATETKLADTKAAQAKEQRVMAMQEVTLARAQLAQRTIYAPVGGVVVDRFLGNGERVEEKPILKVAQIDPLRVELLLPSNRFGQVKPGQAAKVQPELPGAAEMPAKVTIVDRVVDSASNTFRVRLEMPNPGLGLPSGLRCKVAFAS